jgi:hypothetical protein
MTLREKLNVIYPELQDVMLMDFGIILQNDSDGKGDYIAKWEHLTLAQPTQEQLDAVGGE